LWEEIRSNDFFWNRFTMRAALSKGAAFAKKNGDTSRSATYQATADKIKDTLEAHYANGFVMETQSRQKDGATICAFNDGYLGDGVFAPSSKEVAGTISALNQLFCSTFAVNGADTKAGIPGILYGRYAGDNYAGGNPWVLLSAALAELLYRGAAEVAAQGTSTMMDDDTLSAWRVALSLPEDTEVKDAKVLAQAMAGAGDGVLTRIRHHVQQRGFHLDEQLDRNTGTPMSAKDLTWSYATVLKAMHARKQYMSFLA
jgi:glucoamylase